MKPLTSACSRCRRLKVKCRPSEENAAADCQRCTSAGVPCTGRSIVQHHNDPNIRAREAPSVDKLAQIVLDLSESVATLKAQQENRNSSLWLTLSANTRADLYAFYHEKIAPAWPLIRAECAKDVDIMQKHRPLYFRAACAVSVARQNFDNASNLIRETFRHICELSYSDTDPTIDIIEACHILGLYYPYPAKDTFKILLSTSNIAFLTLQQLDEMDSVHESLLDELELERCRLTIYISCNGSRLWQKKDPRLISWGPVLEHAAVTLNEVDDLDRTLVTCAREMRLAEGTTFMGYTEFTMSSEDMFRQNLAIFEAKPLNMDVMQPQFTALAPTLFRLMNVIPMIDAYLDYCRNNSSSLNLPLVIDAITHEGQGLLAWSLAMHDMECQMPTFYYVRIVRSALAIAYLCRRCGSNYFSELVGPLKTIFANLVQQNPFLHDLQLILDRIELWWYSSDPSTLGTTTLPELITTMFSMSEMEDTEMSVD